MKQRIEKIMEMEQLTASKFADAIGVQRSNISHILSGRNKPSLELVNKILDHFQQINADWLLLGKGRMLNESKEPFTGAGYSFNNLPDQNVSKPIKIVIFYADNTFEEFTPKPESGQS